METKRSKLFFKARERIIDEIAIRNVCDAISDDEGIPLPTSWLEQAAQRSKDLIDELTEESLREGELTKPYVAGPQTKARKTDY